MALAAVVCILAGCTDPVSPTPKDDLDLRLHDMGARSLDPAGSGPGFSVSLLDTRQEFADAWQAAYGTPPPTIDFSSRHAVEVRIDAVPSDGWTLRVTNATFQGGVYHVGVTTFEPAADCIVTHERRDVVAFATFDAKLAQADNSVLVPARNHSIVPCAR